MELYYHHYLIADEAGRIRAAWSDGPCLDRSAEGAVLLTDRGGYQLRLTPDGPENPHLFTLDRIPLYQWDGEKVTRRSEADIQADRDARPPEPPAPPTELEQLRADVDFLAAMGGVAL